MIDKNLPVPIYIQLKNYIKESINKKLYLPGQMLPSERELTEKFDVSRMTVRQSISELVNEGFLYKEQGKGTFVARNIIEKDIELMSFSQDMIKRGFVPGSKLIEFVEITPNEHILDNLKLNTDDRVYYLKRLRLADSLPMAIEDSYIPEKVFPNLIKYNMELCSLYNIFKEDYGIKFSYAKQELEACKLKKHDALFLLGKENGFCLLGSRILYTIDNIPIEYTETSYHPDRYKYTMIVK